MEISQKIRFQSFDLVQMIYLNYIIFFLASTFDFNCIFELHVFNFLNYLSFNNGYKLPSSESGSVDLLQSKLKALTSYSNQCDLYLSPDLFP